MLFRGPRLLRRAEGSREAQAEPCSPEGEFLAAGLRQDGPLACAPRGLLVRRCFMRFIGDRGVSFDVRRFDRAGPEDVPLLRSFAEEVYGREFHDKHREPWEDWAGRLTTPQHDPAQFATLVLEHGRVVAGALSERYPPGVALLTYIVVRPDMRGRGLGTFLMGDVRRTHGAVPLFAEIADPSCADAGDAAYASRRAATFRSWGWRLVGCAYHQPPLVPGGQWASDLLLLHHGADGQVDAAHLDALYEGLRRSLDAGPEPVELEHRFRPRAASEPACRTVDLSLLTGGPDGRTAQ